MCTLTTSVYYKSLHYFSMSFCCFVIYQPLSSLVISCFTIVISSISMFYNIHTQVYDVECKLRGLGAHIAGTSQCTTCSLFIVNLLSSWTRYK
ncbi:hypothetical protein GDO81_015476 [Engystomops pustulosus]|uniref:Uncharacterized protein n=1 Tax=Engystomops pustulosus TaxID=76066 RepID=A0AAV7AP59_ENGPU|nr:hypothetical protein GDO81_015476 [Engystomops pustulosus]